jgi:microcystin-dependent protein
MSYQSACNLEFPVPIGTIIFYSGINVPFNYLLADGASILKTEYPYLYEVIGNQFGSSATNFTLPNLITTPYIWGFSTVNPVPNPSSVTSPVATPFTLATTNIPSLSTANFDKGNLTTSYADVNGYAGGAINHGVTNQNFGLSDFVVDSQSTFGPFGASIATNSTNSVVEYINTATAVTPTITSGSTPFQPQNLGLLPCIRYNNTVPVSAITNDHINPSSVSSFFYPNI